MVKKKFPKFEPYKGVTPFVPESHRRIEYSLKAQCEIELCCNCTESQCNGQPCERLKQAYAEAKQRFQNEHKKS